MKKLTIVAMGNDRFFYELEVDGALKEGGLGLDWAQAKKLLQKIEPTTAQGNDHIAMVSRAAQSSMSAQAQCGPWATVGARVPSEYDRLIDRVRELEKIVFSGLNAKGGPSYG